MLQNWNCQFVLGHSAGDSFPSFCRSIISWKEKRQTNGEGNQSPTIFNCPINLFLNSLPFKIPWWSLPSYSLLSTTIHAWRYIYPNSVIGPAPSAGGSVTGPPPGLQPGEIPNHPRIPRTKTRQRETGREKDRYPLCKYLLQCFSPFLSSILPQDWQQCSGIPSSTPVEMTNLIWM